MGELEGGGYWGSAKKKGGGGAGKKWKGEIRGKRSRCLRKLTRCSISIQNSHMLVLADPVQKAGKSYDEKRKKNWEDGRRQLTQWGGESRRTERFARRSQTVGTTSQSVTCKRPAGEKARESQKRDERNRTIGDGIVRIKETLPLDYDTTIKRSETCGDSSRNRRDKFAKTRVHGRERDLPRGDRLSPFLSVKAEELPDNKEQRGARTLTEKELTLGATGA